MQQAATAVEVTMPSAWGMYFPEDEYAADDRRAVLLHELIPRLTHLGTWLGERLQPQCLTDRHTLLLRSDELQEVCKSSELYAALELQPLEALACLAAAAHEVSNPMLGLIC